MSILLSSSSSSMLKRKREFTYGIFLSFNGIDTRSSFTDHLYHALTRQKIETFRDDKSLEKGQDFAPELLRAIRESWGSIIVISERYALSHWCLEELVEIMKQRKERGYKVYPIFFKVQPSDFRHQINRVKVAFDKHEKRYDKETTQGWRVALKEVTDIHGWSLKEDQSEPVIIEGIVKYVSEKFDAEIVDEKEVEMMKNTFQMIQAWLVDTENKPYMKGGETLKVWLDKLKHIAYDMDDVLDEWNTAILKSKIEKDQSQTPSVSSSYTSEAELSICERGASSSGLPHLNLPALKSDSPSTFFQSGEIALHHDIAHRIKELNEKYQAVIKDFPFTLGLNNSCTDLKLQRPKTVSLIDESDVSGRDYDKDTLIRFLLSDDNGEGGIGRGIPIIAIVGMGGLGKTTLAQLAYNNNEVKKHFPKRIWVCVSNPFDEVRIAKGILEALKGTLPCFNELESLLQEIRRNIEGNKFLLVLDDVWTEDEEKWKPLKNSFGFGSKESKILVTTRKEKVAKILGCYTPFSLGVLSKEDSWSLFRKIAFSERINQDCGNLESIGRELVKKCAGLPLAIKTLASLLRFKETEEQWRRVLVSETWKLEEEVFKNLYAPLLLSYYDLPMSSKQCFRYCAIFPKDHQIEKDELINLWMAQGLLGETREVNDLETIGEECFNNLAVRGFFQQFKNDEINGRIIECKMHDIVHDFAQFLTNTECVLAESDGSLEVHKRVESSPEKVRHFTLINPCSNPVPILDPLKKLRGFLVLCSNSECAQTLYASLQKLFHQLINLRMLSLPPVDMEEDWVVQIPKEIGKLIHLRYLSLEGNLRLYALPEALCDLWNLQTLNIRECFLLQKLPCGMEKLTNLRHLQNEGTMDMRFMPKGIQGLTCLQTLECVYIGKEEGGVESSTLFNLADLGKLIHLRGHLEIRGLGNVRAAGEAWEAGLSTKVGLRSLTLDFEHVYEEDDAAAFYEEDDEEQQRRIEDEASVLEALHPTQGLLKLRIEHLKGPAFPLSNTITSLKSLKSVMLMYCYNWESLPPLGKLLSLESLYISYIDKVKKVGEEFLGVETSSSSVNQNIAFPNLKTLEFGAMKGWEEWEYEYERSRGDRDDSFSSTTSDITIIMPKLQRLKLWQCKELKTLPRHLLQSRALKELVIFRSTMLYRRFNKETGEDWPSLSHIPTVDIKQRA